ncbi:hypothetical protein DOE73_10745 [Paenibacillus dendritiformis]|nr:hypothetical protein DOE73_10745 [Paenibacillus dendritiformis]
MIRVDYLSTARRVVPAQKNVFIYAFALQPRLAGFICVRKSNNCGLLFNVFCPGFSIIEERGAAGSVTVCSSRAGSIRLNQDEME